MFNVSRMDEPQSGPMVSKIVSIINAHRVVPDVQVRILPDGVTKNVSDGTAIEWLIVMNAALTLSRVQLTEEVDDLGTRLQALEDRARS
jgi:hypothetical protein